MTTAPYRYPGIHSFTEAEREQFFGRERETEELYRLLVLNPVVVLFGKSGTGKTSLLQAGIAPLLHERGLHPVKVRLNDTTKPISRQIWEQFEQNEYLPLGTPDNLSLLEYCRIFDYTDKGEAMTPLLLLDQFEELFTLYGDKPEAREDFIRQLTELLNDPSPGPAEGFRAGAARVVISIRSDFLFLLDRLSVRIPAILRCRYELSPLDEASATRAITAPAARPGTFASLPFTFSPAALKAILGGLSAQSDAGEKSKEVEAFLLQLFCQQIERRLIAEGKPAHFEVTPAFFGGEAGIEAIRDRYYAEVLALFASDDKRTAVQRLVEENLISAGRRIIAERENIKNQLRLTNEDLNLLCRERLLREEPRGGSYYYELSHDTLLAPVLKAKAERQEREKARELKAEEARIAAEKAKSAKERRRAIYWSIGAATLILIAIGALLWAGYKSKEARREADNATAATKQAEIKTREAAVSDSLAQVAVALAEEKTKEAEMKTRQAAESDSLARVASALAEEKKRAAETAEANAGRATAEAAEQRNLAGRLREEADKASREAEQRKKEAADAAALAVQALLPQIRRDILYLDYAAAFDKLTQAEPLNVLKDSLAFESMELAFFYDYIGKDSLARAAYDQAARLLGKAPCGGLLDLEVLDADRLAALRERYLGIGNMVPLQGGTFTMQGEETGGDVDAYEASVGDFELSRYETTVWQYNLYCAANGRSIAQRLGSDGENEEYTSDWVGDHPVIYVSWYDAVSYANWLSLQWGLDAAYTITRDKDPKNESDYDDFQWTVTPIPGANGFRLPTELEWEFAARGGLLRDAFEYSGSDDIDAVAWYGDNSSNRTHPVGTKKANGAGLYDMSGNVWEWCYDWYGGLPAPGPLGAEAGASRVFRGGSWFLSAQGCRVSDRNYYDPTSRGSYLGFRLARSSNQ